MARIDAVVSTGPMSQAPRAGAVPSRHAAIRAGRLTAVAFVALLSACSFIPKYSQPASPVAAEWPIPPIGQGIGNFDNSVAAAGVGWRQFFNDARLQQLVGLALENNRDLRLALLNIEAARAQYNIERSPLTPSIGVAATGTRQRVPADLSLSGNSMISSQYQVGLGMTAFELDLFGRVRSLSQAALSQYFATEETQRNVQIVLISQVAEAYLNLLASDAQIDLAQRTLASREESFKLVKRRADAGVSSALELNQAQTLLETARSERQIMLRARAQALNALTLLTGTANLPPLEPDPQRFVRADLLTDIPVGLSSAVLLSRPDVLAAEHRLLAANANIGAARAAFFPRISLTAMLGTASPQLSGLFGGGTTAWSFSPQITTPIFAGGSLRNQLALAEIRTDAAVAEYERAIQQAFREVSDALAGTATYTAQITAQQSLVAAARRSRNLAQLRYDSGVTSYLEVQDAERTLFSAQQQLVQTRLEEMVNRVSLYKALGGGWVENTGTAAPLRSSVRQR